ncbi:MAG: multidrug efflux SMR transporter [Paludibacteraceae bacterium]|nr:multidrug efflux SMR transporter [Paludibacteraceae bacterium]
MYWFILVVAGLFEAGFTFCLGMMKEAVSYSTSWWLWLCGFLLALTVSMTGMALACRHIPVGTVYPVWTGIGAVGAVLLGVFFFHEPLTFWRVLFILLLIGSIIGLKMVS